MVATILLVGDERWSKSCRTALYDAGYNVAFTETHKAQDALLHHRPALVVIYLSGCEADDLAVTRTLLDATEAPIIAIGFSRDDGCRVAGLEAGVDDYLTPPINPSELVARVRGILRRISPALIVSSSLQDVPQPCGSRWQQIHKILTDSSSCLYRLYGRLKLQSGQDPTDNTKWR